ARAKRERDSAKHQTKRAARNQDDPAAQNRFRWKFSFSAENLKILPKKNFSSRKSKFPAEREMFSRKFKNSAEKLKVQLENKFFRRKNKNSPENSKIQRNLSNFQQNAFQVFVLEVETFGMDPAGVKFGLSRNLLQLDGGGIVMAADVLDAISELA